RPLESPDPVLCGSECFADLDLPMTAVRLWSPLPGKWCGPVMQNRRAAAMNQRRSISAWKGAGIPEPSVALHAFRPALQEHPELSKSSFPCRILQELEAPGP